MSRPARIHATKVVIVFADVTYKGWEYKVFPNGTVEKWIMGDENVDGCWTWMSDCETGYDEIRAAGLKVLSEYNG